MDSLSPSASSVRYRAGLPEAPRSTRPVGQQPGLFRTPIRRPVPTKLKVDVPVLQVDRKFVLLG